ncbi:Ktr system potassium uptake protein A [Anaerotignum neopropionicum]|uniref:Ktr system potassium uptake protein A n=1 Tax=Anaerotignum neopropionicum TaxID=36847 RepID=A0A136WIP5_9FIRM|nr:TrkA family potassium uptake protein [Anaerotignum neopropionicum]KXL54436.1 Ktr system potassium uptake protein A [Anaerotignum neopropionicum]
MKSFLIIGMGSFGHHLCRSFERQDCEIMIVDEKQENLEDMLPYVTSAKIGDCTNPDVLRSFDVASFDACFVCMGTNFQNSLQITSLLKEMGANKVYSKADEDIQAKFLLRNGADEVIYPEKTGADRVAVRASSDNIFDCIEISDDFYIMEIKPRLEWVGKTIGELDFRRKYHMNIMATKIGEEIFPMPRIDYTFHAEEHLMVLGHIDDIQKVIK